MQMRIVQLLVQFYTQNLLVAGQAIHAVGNRQRLGYHQAILLLLQIKKKSTQVYLKRVVNLKNRKAIA